MTSPNSSRKYTTEFHLVLPVFVRALGLQTELLQADVKDYLDCHLYLVSRTPRFSLPPDSVQISETRIICRVRAQVADTFVESTIGFDHPFGLGISWESDWPYEDFHVVASSGEILSSGVVGLLNRKSEDWPAEWRQHEVLYVGQAFGSDGERSAWDRLQSHGTVQRILGDTTPDKQVWIALAAVHDERMLQDISPGSASKTQAEDDAHVAMVWKEFYDGTLKERDSVALAEAGLIRAFQPEYNDRLKYNFPARKQVPLEQARRLDLNRLVVELNSRHAGAAYSSEVVENSGPLQFFEYSMHLDPERDGIMSLERLSPNPAADEI